MHPSFLRLQDRVPGLGDVFLTKGEGYRVMEVNFAAADLGRAYAETEN